tara:strand:+ start:803 stop:1150 length:348 start_codon:yes stop_codon:yes gene_type:complete
MAFKMKGSPMHRNYGIGAPTKKETNQPAASSTNDDPPKDDRSYWQMLKDEGSQILAGSKNANKRSQQRNSGRKIGGNYFSDFGAGYSQEEDAQAAERSATPKRDPRVKKLQAKRK